MLSFRNGCLWSHVRSGQGDDDVDHGDEASELATALAVPVLVITMDIAT